MIIADWPHPVRTHGSQVARHIAPAVSSTVRAFLSTERNKQKYTNGTFRKGKKNGYFFEMLLTYITHYLVLPPILLPSSPSDHITPISTSHNSHPGVLVPTSPLSAAHPHYREYDTNIKTRLPVLESAGELKTNSNKKKRT